MYMVRSGNFIVSPVGLDCYLVQIRAFSFYQINNLNFQYCFPFSEANCWASLANFLKLSFGGISLWTMTEVWLLLAPLREPFLAEMSARYFP